MLYSKSELDKIGRAHRKYGFRFSTRTDRNKQYVKISTKGVRVLGDGYSYRNRDALLRHMKQLFPNSYITSGCYGADYVDLSFRIK